MELIMKALSTHPLFQEEKSPYKYNECVCKNCKTENKEWIEVLKSWDEWGTCKRCNIKWKLNKRGNS